MPVAVGTHLGPYEVLGLIGAGGMGEVYKARDTRLDRTVAIKVLPAEISGDPDRRARFEREARTIAGVNHPHICTLYDVCAHEDSMVLVMEHLEGETLAHRLQKGALPIESALTIATDIAVALSAAHRQGIIHRDLKPGNVMLTKSGAKLLDFGLAKLTRPDPHGPLADFVSAPTRSAPLTGQGVIVGTLQYMAPEQIEGKPADARSDLWALGTILYEMLTGRRAFEGTSAASLIGNIMNAEPPAVATLQPVAPPALDRLVRKCLAKDPDVRWESAADLADEFRWQAEALRGGSVTGVFPTTAPKLRGALLLVAAALALVGTGAGVMWLLRPVPTGAGVVTTTIKLEPGYWLDGFRRAEDLERPSRTAIAISPDGRSIVYSATIPPGDSRLFLRTIDRSEARPLAGTERGIAPFFSPDARWLGFWADGQLKKIPVEGGLATPLCDLEQPFGASWGGDDSILVANGADGGLAVVSADGGHPEAWTTPDKKRDEASHRLPRWLPDGKGALFTVMRHGYDAHPAVAVLRLDTREWRVLIEDAADARYVATGHLVFLRQGALMGVRFDLVRQEIVGRPVALIDGVMQAFAPNSTFNTAAGQFVVSESGSMVYVAGGVAPAIRNSLVWVDLKGQERPAAPLQFPFFAPRLSPDGERIVYILYGQERHLWVYDLVRGTNTRVHDQGMSSFPTWTPDGKHILFGWQKSARINLFQQPADGSAAMERVTTSDCDQRVGSWSRDGETVALVEWCKGSGWNISVLGVRSRQVTPLIASDSAERYPEFSPDGRWIAYSSDETKRDEVYVQRVRGSGKFQVSTGGGIQPLWSKDGTKLFYRWLDQVWVVDVRMESGLPPGTPRLLFERQGYSLGAPIRGYDLSLDSQRFLMVKLDRRSPSPATEMILVQNWVEDLKSKLPAGK
jgi:eukaryotic-like serine/threonine-protein kinase